MSKVFISAGERSGDLMGASIMRSAMRMRSDLIFTGIGGECMRNAGMRALFNAEDFSVTGFTEAIPVLPRAIRAVNACAQVIREEKFDKAIFIDFPEVNLRLLTHTKKAGSPSYYVSPPQVWAWREGRLKKLTAADELLCILPFEETYYRSRGLNARYVGHPSVERIENEVKGSVKKSQVPILALLPGSRWSEVSRHMKIFRRLLPMLKGLGKHTPAVKVAVPPYLHKKVYNNFKDLFSFFNVELKDDGLLLLAEAHWAVVASGTASLEAALVNTPSVVIYVLAPLSFALGRMMVNVNFIALPNIIAGEEVFPELIQKEASAERVFRILKRWILEGVPENTFSGCSKVRERTGGQVFSEEVTKRIFNG